LRRLYTVGEINVTAHLRFETHDYSLT